MLQLTIKQLLSIIIIKVTISYFKFFVTLIIITNNKKSNTKKVLLLIYKIITI